MYQNLITLKIKYSCNNSFLDVIKQYNSVLKFTLHTIVFLKIPNSKRLKLHCYRKI